MIQYLCLMGFAIFGFLIGSMMASAHDDPFTQTLGVEDLIKRDTSQEPYPTPYEKDYAFVCPECLYAFKGGERPDFCPDCGQRIRWED